MAGTLESLSLQLSSGFGQGLEPVVKGDTVEVEVSPRQVPQLMRFAREQLGFDMLTSITAVDDVENFQLLYHLTSVRPVSSRMLDPAYPGYLLARVRVEKQEPVAEFEPEVPSVSAIFPGAIHQEREIWDLMGIRFKGHPDLRRILTWEGFPGHPLRKDWVPLNVEIPWHLAGLKGYGGEAMEAPPAEARIAVDGSGIGEAIPVGTTPQSFEHPPTRPPKPTEKLHLHIGQGGVTDDEPPSGAKGGARPAGPNPPAAEGSGG